MKKKNRRSENRNPAMHFWGPPWGHPPWGCLCYLSEGGEKSGQSPHRHGWATSGVFSYDKNLTNTKNTKIQKVPKIQKIQKI